MSFVHLHVHSQYSLLDGAITIDRLIARAKETGMPAVALTDHGNLHGLVEFHQKATEAGIQPVLGIEAYVTHGDRRDRSPQFPTYHLTLLARDETGLRNLYRLTSLASFEGYYYKPRMDREILRNHGEGLIALSGCLNGAVARFLRDGREDLAEAAARDYAGIFGEGNYCIEIMDNGLPEQKAVTPGLLDLARRLSLPVVATNDCHYLDREDAKAHDVLLCIGQGKAVQDEDRMRFPTDQFHVRGPAEMRELFAHCPEAVANTLAIARRCDVRLKLGEHCMPTYEIPGGKTPDAYLEELARTGLEERLPAILAVHARKGRPAENVRAEYLGRLESELATIRATGFSGYLLIVADFINYAKGNRIPVGPGRGSAAGSLVAYATRITDIDPIPYGLLFERFLNAERVSMPDIDVDFCQDRRDEVIRYVSGRYGASSSLEETKVAQITTFGKMQAKAVIRDVGRALGMAYGEVDRIAKLVPSVLNITLEEAFEQEPRFAELRKKDARVDELLTIAVSLEGLTRHASVHAAGVVISDDRPLVHHLPLYRGQHDEVVTQWDMKGVEKIGLIKFDFLGLKTLTLLDRTVKMVGKATGEAIDLLHLDLADPRVYELLGRADTQGVFQLESSGMRDLVVKLKPSSFEDIIALVALYRPGPLGSGMVDDFINRKHGRTPIHYDLPQLESVLRETYGVILYQEQVMQIAAVLANYSLGEADLLRRAMGKKIPAEMARQESRFMEGCAAHGIPKEKAERIFHLMAKFAGYGFNKSHSAGYAMISYQTAYLKAHHPAEFMAASLSIDRANTDRVVLLLADCRSQGLDVLPPDVNESHLDFSVVGGKIRFGLAAVKNVGEAAIEAVLKAREEGPFRDLFDFCRRVDLKRVNKRVIESLVKCGAFDSTGGRRSTMMASLERATEAAQRTQRDREVGQGSLFGVGGGSAGPERPAYTDAPDWEETERLKYEKESVGFYVTGHPLLKHSELLRRYANADTARLKDLKDQSTARIGGVISSVKEITTRKGDRMAFATLEDLTGSVELVVFSDPYRYHSELFKGEDPVFVVGKVDQDEEQAKILVSDAALLTEAHKLFSGTVHIAVDSPDLPAAKMEGLKKLIGAHRGACPTVLHVRIPGESETVLSLPRDYAVSPSTKLIEDLTDLLGSSAEVRFS